MSWSISSLQNCLKGVTSRQCGRMGKGIVFYDDPDQMIWVQPAPRSRHCIFGKTLYDDYLCLMASNKQQIQWTRIRRNPQEHWIIENS